MKLNKVTKLAIVGLGICTAAMAAPMAIEASFGDVTLGTVELTGGSKVIDVDPGAVGIGTSIVGRLTNSTGGPLNDVSVCVISTGSATVHPTSGGPIVVTGAGSDSSSGGTTDHPSGKGFCANIEFTGGPGNVGPVPVGSTVGLEIPISNAGNATNLHVKITPSVERKSGDGHSDLLSASILSETTPGVTQGMGEPFHSSASMVVFNRGTKQHAPDIVALTGKLISTDGSTLTSLALRDPSRNYDSVVGAVVTITGASFDIRGFGGLRDGQSYELKASFSSAPESSYRLRVEAEFSDE